MSEWDDFSTDDKSREGYVKPKEEAQPERGVRMCKCGHPRTEHLYAIFGIDACRHTDCDGCDQFTEELPAISAFAEMRQERDAALAQVQTLQVYKRAFDLAMDNELLRPFREELIEAARNERGKGR